MPKKCRHGYSFSSRIVKLETDCWHPKVSKEIFEGQTSWIVLGAVSLKLMLTYIMKAFGRFANMASVKTDVMKRDKFETPNNRGTQ